MSTISLLTLSIYIYIYIYIFNSFYLFIFGYAGSSLLHEGFSLVEVCGLLTVVAYSSRACGLSSCGSVLLHELCCPVACGIFPDQDQTRILCIGREILYH